MSGDTEKQISVSDINWKRLGQIEWKRLWLTQLPLQPSTISGCLI